MCSNTVSQNYMASSFETRQRRVGECVSGDVWHKVVAWEMIKDDHGCRDN